jgi:FixJ family two-component response regulator
LKTAAKSIVFIVDDEAMFTTTVETILRQDGFAVETFSSAEAFLEREPYTGVGCLLLDLALPGMDGMTLLETLRQRPLTTPIIILTGNGDIPASVRSMKQGAMDFLTKPIPNGELIRAVEEALALSRRIQPFCKRLGSLTPREWQVLEGMLYGLLNKQIATRLGISVKTTKVHRGRIMDKLAIPSLPELVRRWVESRLPMDPIPLRDSSGHPNGKP